MAAAGKWKAYDLAKKYIGDTTLDLDDTTNWKCALFTSSSNCNTLTHDVYGDLTGEVANGNGYTTGGWSVTGVTFSESSGTVTFDCDNPNWTASGGSIVARFAVFYKNATVNSLVKPLFCVCLLDTAPADKTTTDGNTFTITIAATGVITLSGGNVD